MPKYLKNRYYDLNTNFRDAADNSYRSSDTLILWSRFERNNPEDLSPSQMDLSYKNYLAASGSMELIGSKRYPAAEFNDLAQSNAEVTDNTFGRLSFTSLADDGDPSVSPVTDRPFTISFWINFDAIETGGSHYIFAKQHGSSGYEYIFWLGTDEKFVFRLRDEDSDKNQAIKSAAAISSGDWDGKWNHIAVTYDGRGGARAYEGMSIYINSSLHSTENSSSESGYVGMQPDYAKPLHIGGNATGGNEVDGKMLEFAAWHTDLEAEEIAALYNTTRNSKVISGFLNNPPRTVLRDRDNLTGSYPTVVRSGDPDFTGKSRSFFDDSKTVNFYSSYGEGAVRFSAVPFDADAIMLTGTNDSKVLFEFQRGVLQYYKAGVSGESNASTLVNITGNQNSRSVAFEFAKSVNSSSLGIRAVPFGSAVKLRHHVPGAGAYNKSSPTSGNQILTASALQKYRNTPVAITQFFISGPEEIVFPQMLDSGSHHMHDVIASPNASGTMTAPGIMTRGVTDAGILFNAVGENISPFNESRIYIDNDHEFYATGTNASVVPGFGQRLSSKTSFSFDVRHNSNEEIYFSTGTAGSSESYSGVNSGLSYYNFKDKRFEQIGDLSTGSNVDFMNQDLGVATGSYLSVLPGAFMMNYAVNYDGTDAELRNALDLQSQWSGLPTNNSGFPLSNKFDATGSHLIKMSEYIDTPFLLEKIVLEVSAAFGVYPIGKFRGNNSGVRNSSVQDPNPCALTFMFLNQFETPFTGTVSAKTLTAISHSPEPDVAHLSSSVFNVNRQKDIVWYARYTAFHTNPLDVSEFVSYIDNITGSALSRDETSAEVFAGGISDFRSSMPNTFSAFDHVQPVRNIVSVYTGSIMFEAPPRTVPIQTPDFGGPNYARVATGSRQPRTDTRLNEMTMSLRGTSEFGGRSLFDLSAGRSYVKSVSGGSVAERIDLSIDIDNSGDGSADDKYYIRVYTMPNTESPYLLMPTDNLVLAVANQSQVAPTDTDGSTANDAGFPKPFRREGPMSRIYRFDPHSMKATFYGSQIRDGKPVEFNLNQPLTSDAIHEDVRDDTSPYGESRCLDQFDVEPRTTFANGYLDLIISGNIRSDRAVQATVVGGGAGTTGSLQRFVRIPDGHRQFYDSAVGAPGDYHAVSGKKIIKNMLLGSTPLVGALGVGPSGEVYDNFPPERDTLDNSWMMSYPFAPEYSHIPRLLDFGGVLARGSFGRLYDAIGDEDEGDTWTTGSPAPRGQMELKMIYFDQSQAGNNAVVVSDLQGNTDLGRSTSQVLKFYFGIGDGTNNMPSFTNTPATGLKKAAALLRGFKYGLINAVPQMPAAVYRYDTFGQYRDMLEQSLQGRMIQNAKLLDPAVEITYFSRTGESGVDPSITNSQNLSFFATSSLPYFDGVSRDRTDTQPDLVQDIEIDFNIT